MKTQQTEQTQQTDSTENAKQVKPLNLTIVATKLLNSERIIKALQKDDKVVTAKELARKIPYLEILGDMPLIQLSSTDDGYRYLTPSIYSRDGKPVVVLPDINATVNNDFKIINWKAGDVNNATIAHKKHDILLGAAMLFTPQTLEMIQVDFDNRLEGQGIDTLEPRWLKPAPEIELPLRSLPIDIVFTILDESDRRSKQYNTQLLNLKDEKDNIYKNVITNSDLRQLFADGCQQFKIISVEPVNVENQKSTTKAGKIRTSYRVLLEPCDGADFSDF